MYWLNINNCQDFLFLLLNLYRTQNKLFSFFNHSFFTLLPFYKGIIRIIFVSSAPSIKHLNFYKKGSFNFQKKMITFT